MKKVKHVNHIRATSMRVYLAICSLLQKYLIYQNLESNSKVKNNLLCQHESKGN